MQLLHFLVISALSLVPLTAASQLSDVGPPACDSPTVVSERFIGANKDVKVQAIHCEGDEAVRAAKRQTPPSNVCGDTNCFPPAGGGPDPNECHVISDALLFDSENVGALFTIPVNASVVTMQYRSCKSFFKNQDVSDEQYCRTDWAAVLDFVAFNCQATQNAHGGLCVAADQRWFIQVQNSSG
ncbi:hypothetical protein K474DRAFT_1632725 [Panus rudis PR-1116 ss-1]|nr:hypothetical protein K474DRAFT_1632725 [Panus rudis PR-1116 ss-1]